MMRYTCQACERGMHEMCAGERPPPPGMMGGSECDCDGKCGEKTKQDRTDDQVDALVRLMNDRSKLQADEDGASGDEGADRG